MNAPVRVLETKLHLLGIGSGRENLEPADKTRRRGRRRHRCSGHVRDVPYPDTTRVTSSTSQGGGSVVRQHLEMRNSFLERLNAGLVVAIAFCVSIWMVLAALIARFMS